ncbi:unnamed protein product [Dimorphilus gyrociliatus]|uniref:Ig-like domain-containing protein n=1 Tax=Dimorphilus gyrociliatus TaxID=2664684 RepID=A0A7I8VPB0_9ANNE|nr:unnamed protein product [Dimorphilus gyrociliatus]
MRVVWLIALISLVSGKDTCDICTCVFFLESKVSCDQKDLARIPDAPKEDFYHLDIAYADFRHSPITRQNFTGYNHLKTLTLVFSKIRSIKVKAFSKMRHLKALTLSGNKLRRIHDYTFEGLHLNILNLADNKGLSFSSFAFSGMTVKTLLLSDCKITTLNPNVFRPISNSLTTLNLENNKIKQLEPTFLDLFRQIKHIELRKNPFKCDCQARWLKDVYNVKKELPAPTCDYPPNLQNKTFRDLSTDDFNCILPTFTDIDASFSENSAKLKCSATGSPVPRLYWIKPSTRDPPFVVPPTNPEDHYNEAIFHATRPHSTTKWTLYKCVASNKVGNTTLTLNITWPNLRTKIVSILPSDFPHRRKKEHRHDFGDDDDDDDDDIIDDDHASLEGQYTKHRNKFEGQEKPERVFNITELVGAVVGTHICTVLLCIVIFPLFFKRRLLCSRSRPKHPGTSLSASAANVKVNKPSTADCYLHDRQFEYYPPAYMDNPPSLPRLPHR